MCSNRITCNTSWLDWASLPMIIHWLHKLISPIWLGFDGPKVRSISSHVHFARYLAPFISGTCYSGIQWNMSYSRHPMPYNIINPLPHEHLAPRLLSLWACRTYQGCWLRPALRDSIKWLTSSSGFWLVSPSQYPHLYFDIRFKSGIWGQRREQAYLLACEANERLYTGCGL